MAARLRATRALALAGLFMLALPAATTAAPPERFSDHRVFVSCAFLQAETADAYVSFGVSERNGPDAALQIWLHPDDIITQPPTLVSGTPSIALAPDGGTMSGTVDLLPGDLGIASAGTATVLASLTPSGPSWTTDNRFNDANFKQHESETITPLDVTGTLTVASPGRPDAAFALDSCTAIVSDVTFFRSAPSSSVIWSDRQVLLCTYVDDEVYVGLHLEREGTHVSGDMAIITPTVVLSGTDAPVTLDARGFTARFALESTGAGIAELSGTAELSGALTALEATSFELRREGGRTRITIQPFSAAGSMQVALSDGSHMTIPLDDVTCHTNEARSEREMASSSDGANRRPVANDVPSSARVVTPGSVLSQHTGGAAFEGEAFASCIWEGPMLLNVAHSVWYAVSGTGQPMTFSTAGSSFDTVAAAYVDGAGGLTEVACNDESGGSAPHQAELTFDTEAGVTYLVQVGGYVDQSGHLRLRVD